MSNTISVNLENLTDAERQQLMNIVKKSQNKKKWWEGTKFDVKKEEAYYFVKYDGNVVKTLDVNSRVDEEIIDFGNVCKDIAYMKRRAKEIKLYNLLSNFAEVVNEGWTPDWENEDEAGHAIYYNHAVKNYIVFHNYQREHLNAVYFKTKELAQRAIDEIILPFERGEL